MTDRLCEGCLVRRGKTCKPKNRKHAAVRACEYYPGYEDTTAVFTLEETVQRIKAVEAAHKKYLDTHILIDERAFISVDPTRAKSTGR